MGAFGIGVNGKAGGTPYLTHGVIGGTNAQIDLHRKSSANPRPACGHNRTLTLRTAGTISESNCGLADPFHPERSYTIRTETRRKLQQLKLQLS
jgi:hypothetical protein